MKTIITKKDLLYPLVALALVLFVVGFSRQIYIAEDHLYEATNIIENQDNSMASLKASLDEANRGIRALNTELNSYKENYSMALDTISALSKKQAELVNAVNSLEMKIAGVKSNNVVAVNSAINNIPASNLPIAPVPSQPTQSLVVTTPTPIKTTTPKTTTRKTRAS